TLPGAVAMHKALNFMSAHPGLYGQLKAHPEWVVQMASSESKIDPPMYVPNAQVKAIEPLLKTGDIVGIATSAEGLDCAHTGLVYWGGSGICHFLNASSVQHKVVLGEQLSEYATKYKRNL